MEHLTIAQQLREVEAAAVDIDETIEGLEERRQELVDFIEDWARHGLPDEDSSFELQFVLEKIVAAQVELAKLRTQAARLRLEAAEAQAAEAEARAAEAEAHAAEAEVHAAEAEAHAEEAEARAEEWKERALTAERVISQMIEFANDTTVDEVTRTSVVSLLNSVFVPQ